MFNKRTLTLAAGAAVGTFIAPQVLNALNIPPSEGFGTDDIVTAIVIAASVMLVDSIL